MLVSGGFCLACHVQGLTRIPNGTINVLAKRAVHVLLYRAQDDDVTASVGHVSRVGISPVTKRDIAFLLNGGSRLILD